MYVNLDEAPDYRDEPSAGNRRLPHTMLSFAHFEHLKKAEDKATGTNFFYN